MRIRWALHPIPNLLILSIYVSGEPLLVFGLPDMSKSKLMFSLNVGEEATARKGGAGEGPFLPTWLT